MKEKLNTLGLIIGIITGSCTMIDFYFTHFYKTATNSQSKTVSQQALIKDTTQNTKFPQIQKDTAFTDNTEKSNFFVTFFKTPVTYFVIIITAIVYFFVGLFQFFINLFTKFDTGFNLTVKIWDWGWHDVTINWYWNNAVSWHFWLSVCVWAFIFSAFNKE